MISASSPNHDSPLAFSKPFQIKPMEIKLKKTTRPNHGLSQHVVQSIRAHRVRVPFTLVVVRLAHQSDTTKPLKSQVSLSTSWCVKTAKEKQMRSTGDWFWDWQWWLSYINIRWSSKQKVYQVYRVKFNMRRPWGNSKETIKFSLSYNVHLRSACLQELMHLFLGKISLLDKFRLIMLFHACTLPQPSCKRWRFSAQYWPFRRLYPGLLMFQETGRARSRERI